MAERKEEIISPYSGGWLDVLTKNVRYRTIMIVAIPVVRNAGPAPHRYQIKPANELAINAQIL